ncbi:hypothetical protein [Zhihengliuella sp. ISTPL4]|uniref:hypothetical protein n=1 Tax=Zhihengliuella sp. ISTPL4 TaxID=2058657 RepID=UPI000C79ABB7|nr:hypothetical protein [Zhihengliuella sp. ISTPL4]
MRPRALLALGAVAVLLLSGCAPEPEGKPTGTPTAAGTPAPTGVPADAPTPAFDVDCADVAAAMPSVNGGAGSEVAEVLGVWSSPSWYPGPAQHMFQRAGGIACSAGTAERNWEVTILPDATEITTGAESRGGFSGEEARCEGGGYCFFQLIDGEVLVTATVVDPELGPDDTTALEDALRGLAASAVASLRTVEAPESAVAGVDCTRFLTAAELGEQIGTEVHVVDAFGGWSIPAEVYQERNGSRICYYASAEDEYAAQGYVTLTSLPGGAWAFDALEGEDEIEVAGADAALTGVDELGRPVLDLRVGGDWLRLTTFDGSGIDDLAPIAATIADDFAVTRPGGE